MTGLLLVGNHVRVNWGRWLADCPVCPSAMQVYEGQGFVSCGDCGTPIVELIWPTDPLGIETILLMRPAEKTRNWLPGETMTDLLVENAAHGIFPRGLTGAESGLLMQTIDGRISGGLVGLQLTSDTRRHQIESGAYGLD